MEHIKIPSSTTLTSTETASTTTPSKLISLAHIKQSSLPSPTVKICWTDGIVFSNADQAAVAFIKRLQSKGKELTEQQKALLAKFYNNDDANSSTTNLSSSANGSNSSTTTVHSSSSTVNLPKIVSSLNNKQTTIINSTKSTVPPLIVKRQDSGSSIGIKRSNSDNPGTANTSPNKKSKSSPNRKSTKGGGGNQKGGNKPAKNSQITLTDKLSMSLDDLAKGGNKK